MFYRKWFWVGIIISLFSAYGGVIYGLALLFEKDRRREGMVVILVALVWSLLWFFYVGSLWRKAGVPTPVLFTVPKSIVVPR